MALAVLIEVFKLSVPLLVRSVVDHVLLDPKLSASQRLWNLNVLGAALAGLVALEQLVAMAKDNRQRLVDAKMRALLRRNLIERLLDLPLPRLTDMKTGGILSRLTGDVELTSGIMDKAVVLPAALMVRLVFASSILLALNWQLAVAVLTAIPGLLLISHAMAKKVRPIYYSIRTDSSAIDGRAAEVFAGIRVVRAFHRKATEILQYTRGQHTMLRKEMFASRLESYLWLAWGLLLGGTNVVIVWYGGHLYLRGRASLGDIMAFQWYSLLLLSPVVSAVQSLSQVQRAQAAAERITEVLAMNRDKADHVGAVEAPSVVREIRFEHVEFHYRAGRPVLTDINLSVCGGAMVALVGRSGAGKTTVTDLVARFLDPTRGRIALNGQDIREFRIRSYQSLFAIVQQHTFLFDGSVRDNIAYGRPGALDCDVETAARRANAHDFIERLPEGYDTNVGERGVKLSGGQQQRLAIARALLKAPAILIMDEATSNLDSESERLIQESMAVLMRSRTTFVIAHRLSTVRQADLILVLEDGRIVEQGRHEELMRSNGWYRRMVDKQALPGTQTESVLS